jgi:hypothetical protein
MPLPGAMVNSRELAPCPHCGKKMDLRVYPAQFREAQSVSTGELLMVDGEASCFYHPRKKASIPCDWCGRFLCSLCDVDLAGKHLCPACIDTGQKKGKLVQLENKRILWDSAALAMALLPVIVWFITLVTAPVAIIIAIMAFKKPSSVVPRTRIRIYLALLIATAQLVTWGVVGAHLLSRTR